MDTMIVAEPTEAEFKQMATVLGVTDETILHRISAMGFTNQTARLLWLLPSLQVAWADGYVSLREGELLCRAACSRFAFTDGNAKALWQQWLAQRPGATFFQQAIDSIHDILATLPAADRAVLKQNLLTHCDELVEASRPVNGWPRRSLTHERKVISQLAVAL